MNDHNLVGQNAKVKHALPSAYSVTFKSESATVNT